MIRKRWRVDFGWRLDGRKSLVQSDSNRGEVRRLEETRLLERRGIEELRNFAESFEIWGGGGWGK